MLIKTNKGIDLDQLRKKPKLSPDEVNVDKNVKASLKSSASSTVHKGFNTKAVKDQQFTKKTSTRDNSGSIKLTQKELQGFYEDCRRLDNVLKNSKALMKQLQQYHTQVKTIFPEFADLHKKLDNASWNVKAYMKLGEDRGKPTPKFVTSTQEDDLPQVVRDYKKVNAKRKQKEVTYDSDEGSIRSGSDVHFSDEDDEIDSDSVYDPDNTQTQSTQSTGLSTGSVVSPVYECNEFV